MGQNDRLLNVSSITVLLSLCKQGQLEWQQLLPWQQERNAKGLTSLNLILLSEKDNRQDCLGEHFALSPHVVNTVTETGDLINPLTIVYSFCLCLLSQVTSAVSFLAQAFIPYSTEMCCCTMMGEEL